MTDDKTQKELALTGSLSNKYTLLRETYELTAKLLAAENIGVIFSRGLQAPALFDIERRILKVNYLADDQIHLTPGLVAHEVGHAKYTNATKTDIEALKKRGFSHLFNAIEDGYQERHMCKDFPGSKKHLRTVFDYFFTNDKKANKDSTGNKIVDIVNVLNWNCKGAKHGNIKKYPSYVLPEDLVLLFEAENLSDPVFNNRWEFVKKLSQALKKYASDADGADGDSGGLGMGGDSGQDLLENDHDYYRDSDGNMVNAEGNRIDASGNEIKDKDGNPVKGTFKDAEGNKVDLDGNRLDDDGNVMTDENGNPISGKFKDDSGNMVNKDGDRVDENGNPIKDENGNPVPGDFSNSQSVGSSPGKGQQLRPGKGKGMPGPGMTSEGDEGDGDGDGQGNGSGGKYNNKKNLGSKGSNQSGKKELSKSDGAAALAEIDKILSENKKDLNDHHEKFKFSKGKDCLMLADAACLEEISEMTTIFKGSSGRLDSYNELKRYKNAGTIALFNDHSRRAKIVAQSIYSRFNVLKTTHNVAKTQYRKTGSLDPTRLSQYKWSDDIFISKEVAPNNTNHGVVVVLDWSGSMKGSTMPLVQRIMELTYFCQLADVQCEVLLYTTGDGKPGALKRGKPAIYDKVFVGSKFIQVVDTKLGQFNTNASIEMLWYLSAITEDIIRMDAPPFMRNLGLGGTNVLESIILGHDRLDKMDVEHKALFVLTDGEDSGSFSDAISSLSGQTISVGGYYGNRKDYDIIFNGQSVADLVAKYYGKDNVSAANIRIACSRVLCDYYRMTKKHTTRGICWNSYSHGLKTAIGGTPITIKAKAGRKNADYVEMDNVFVREIVDSLINNLQ